MDSYGRREHIYNDDNYEKKHGKMKYNNRKRKQINNISSGPTRSAKVRALSDNNTEVTAMECDTQFALDELPMILLTKIVSYLGIYDQKNLSNACRTTKAAVQQFWDTCTDLHIGSLMTYTFPHVKKSMHCSLRAIRKEIILTLRLLPNFALRSINFQPICSLHVQDLQDIEILTKKSAEQIYGAVKHLDLRGCSLEYEELQYFSRACTRLTSIAITHAAVFLPEETFINEEYIKQNIPLEERPLEKIQNFLHLSLPNFWEMKKKGLFPKEHIELLVKLLKLFPYLEKFHID